MNKLRIFFVLLFLVVPGMISADQFNDLYYIDPGGVPDLSEEGKESESGPPADAGSGSGDDSSDNGSNNENNSSGAGPGADGDSSTGSGAESEEDALEELLDDGAVQGEGVGEGSETEEEGGIWGGSGGGSVSIDGERVRARARGDSDLSAVLRYWKLGGAKKTSTKGRLNPFEHYALIAATLAAEDEQLESASFSGGRFEIVYRTRGALFWFIPMSFPVRLAVSPGANAGERVQVRLPWYRLFVNEYFTPASLSGEVETLLTAELENRTGEEDMQAYLFELVAQFLRQKVRTIGDSILLK